jgi:hypothetical protein
MDQGVALTRSAVKSRESIARTSVREPERAPQPAWGRVPLLSLLSALGLLIEVLADQGGRASAPWADPVFWVGLLLIFVPTFTRISRVRTPRGERVALLVVLCLALYLVKVLQYPLYFGLPDEYQHLLTAQNIAQSGHLFGANNLLPIGSLYPGLEIVTNALSHATGMPLFAAALTVVGVVRLLLMLALFLFFEQVSGSHRVAAIGAALYLANPLFLLFDAQYAYESLAIPLAAAILFVVMARGQASARDRFGWSVILWLSFAALAVTHHVTALALSALLLLWSCVYLVSRRRSHAQAASPVLAVAGTLECNLAWLIFAGSYLFGYLSPDVISAVGNLLRIMSGEAAPRQLFQDRAGDVAPAWERLISIGSVGLLTLGIVAGLYVIWRRARTNIAALALGIGALAYPVSQVFRVTSNGAEVATRGMDLFFIAVAFTAGLAFVQMQHVRPRSTRVKLLAFVAVLIVFVGGCITGTAPMWQRLPGPYLVEGDGRAIGQENITAAQWAQAHLRPGSHVAADRDDAVLMATYGHQTILTTRQNTILMPLFFASSIGAPESSLLKRVPVRYLVIDSRLSTDLPATGVYYEPGGDPLTRPISAAALAKYDSTASVDRIYDSGDIVIYDLGLLDGSEHS